MRSSDSRLAGVYCYLHVFWCVSTVYTPLYIPQKNGGKGKSYSRLFLSATFGGHNQTVPRKVGISAYVYIYICVCVCKYIYIYVYILPSLKLTVRSQVAQVFKRMA